MALSSQEITHVINCCNRDIVPDPNYTRTNQYESEWFISYFSFLGNPSLQKQLGEAFYQARFNYKLMSVLQLPVLKYKGIVKFQIIQYAAICEAILDHTINLYFKNESRSTFSDKEYMNFPNALSITTQISYENEKLYICKQKIREKPLKLVRIDRKTSFAVSKNIISQDIKEKVDALYDLRNNVHIIKSAEANYHPKLKEAKEAFLLMQQFVAEVSNFYLANRI